MWLLHKILHAVIKISRDVFVKTYLSKTHILQDEEKFSAVNNQPVFVFCGLY